MSARLPESIVAAAVAELEDKEAQRLKEFKEEVIKQGIELKYDDWCYVRFLRARNLKVNKAIAFFKETEAMRRELHADGIVAGFEPPPTALKAWCHGWYGLDREGHPVYHQAVGNVDPSGLLKGGHASNILQLEMCSAEGANIMYEWLSQHRQELISQTTMIFDLQNLGWKHLNRGFISLFTGNVDSFEALYPETLKRVLIINAPRVFEYAMTFVRPFLTERTLNKFVVVRTNPEAVYAKVAEFIEPRWIPQRYGGTVPDEETGISFAGPVDPSNYAYAHFNPTSSVNISKREPHTEEIELATGDVFRWSIGSQEVNEVAMKLTNDEGDIVIQRSCSVSSAPIYDFYRADQACKLLLTISISSSKTKRVELDTTVTCAVDTLRSHSYAYLAAWWRRHLPDFEPHLHTYPWLSEQAAWQAYEADKQDTLKQCNSQPDAALDAGKSEDLGFQALLNSLTDSQDPVCRSRF
eukprot:m.46050 g.46050  ORF g.46050 m.46050 type:complete len:468 (-) comp13112_c0_seq5:2165-3568(-)